jgi:predicted enzyme related to lactoylglutathione lyase
MAMGNAVVHFEVGAADDQSLVAFYSELFGWDATSMEGGGYTTIDTRAGTGINGGIGRSSTGEPWSTFYVAAEDPQAILDKATELGGTVVMPVTDFGGVVTIAMFNDPDGLLVGVVKAEAGSDNGAPAPSPGAGAAVDWFEVLGSAAEGTQRFYCDLFGWTVDTSGFPGYGLVDTGAGQGIQGGLGDSDGSTWATIYARVPDVEQALGLAEKLGGSRVYGPNPVGENMQTGALRDPAGNVFGVYQSTA